MHPNHQNLKIEYFKKIVGIEFIPPDEIHKTFGPEGCNGKYEIEFRHEK